MIDLNQESIPDIIDEIENHAEYVRMKKILYGLTNKVWENDPNVINNCSLYTMLMNLTKVRPTMKRLVGATNNLIKSLNRQEVYVTIAKDFLYITAPLYNTSSEAVEALIQETVLEEKEKREKQKDRGCINLIEIIVKEEIYNELQKLPVNIAKFMSIAEVASYTLNRLPPMYISSEEGKVHQMAKIEQMRGEIRTAVLQGIGAVMRDPLRKSTPLNLDEVDSFSTAHEILVELEEFVQNLEGEKHKISLDELSLKIQLGIRAYHTSLMDIEQALDLYNIEHEKITAKNLGSIVRNLLRKLDPGHKDSPKPAKIKPARVSPIRSSRSAQKTSEQDQLDAQQTSIAEFLEDHENDDNGDETFATSIRDWYSF